MDPSLLNQWFEACEKGQLSTLAGMVARGVCVNAASPVGRRALPYACRGGDLALAKALLKLGADPNLFSSFDGQPVACAVRSASLPLVQYLLDRGGKPDAIDEEGHWALLDAISAAPALFHVLLDAGANPNTVSVDGETALMYCVRFARMRELDALLTKGASVDAVDADGATALSRASTSMYVEAPRMVGKLLAAGANPNHRANTGWTPLMGAACRASRDTSMIDLLLAAGADLFACAVEEGEVLDPLRAAITHGKPHAVERLSRAVREALAAGTVPVEGSLRTCPRL